jgi:hypothetical protein
MEWLEPAYPALPLLGLTLPFAVGAAIAVRFLRRSGLPFLAKAAIYTVIYFGAFLIPAFIFWAAGLWPSKP